MYDLPLTAAGAGVGGAAGSGLGVLGRSPLLDLLHPLDYPRQAAWNLVRGPARLLQGEGGWKDLLGMLPGLAGVAGAALGPLGMLGGALAGGAAQGLGHLTGSDAFEASTPQDITGSEDFLPNLAVGAATDPLMYAGLGLGGHAGMKAAQGLTDAAAERAMLSGPEGAINAMRLEVPRPGLENLAVRQGLSGRNQALGEVVGDVAQAREARSGQLAEQVQQQLRPPVQANPAGVPLPGQSLAGTPPLTPEQHFEQMLPTYARNQRAYQASTNPRNALPPALADLTTEEVQGLGRIPTRYLSQEGGELPPEILRQLDAMGGLNAPLYPEEAAQLRRHAAASNVFLQGRQDLEQFGPLAAQLAKSGQLGSIEGRLNTHWAMLHDMMAEGKLTPEQLLQHGQRGQLEQEAFASLFDQNPRGVPQSWMGQQGIMNHLMQKLGQAHEGLEGVNRASEIESALRPGSDYNESGLFGGVPITPQQYQQAQLARGLEGSLREANVGHLQGEVSRHAQRLGLSRDITDLPGRFAADPQAGNLESLLREAMSHQTPLRHNWWEPGGGTHGLPEPPQPTPSSYGTIGEGPPASHAFPSLDDALSQAQAHVGRPLQPWEIKELEQALLQRDPGPFQQRGILGDLEQAPFGVGPAQPRGASFEIQSPLGQVASRFPEVERAVLGLGRIDPASVLGTRRIEQQLGRPLTEAEFVFIHGAR